MTQVQIIDAGPGHWYRHHIGQVFDVKRKEKTHSDGFTYVILNTKHNAEIIAPKLHPRIKSNNLGIRESNCTEVMPKTNREALSLLSKE